jgi:uncharacterized SAM-binding protein YcdF (DUF218 family)
MLLFSDLPARWLVVVDPPGPVDAAVVMAGDVGYERTATAARLLQAGQARLLVVTGGEPGPGDSAESLRARAIALGVPADRIRMETVSRSTREALLAVAPLLAREGVRSIALVSSPYHQRRAVRTARKALPGLVVRSCPASPSFWSPRGWWREPGSRRIVLTEYGKLLYYAAHGWL